MDHQGESCGAATAVEDAQRERIESHVLGGCLKRQFLAEKEWESGNFHPVPGPEGEWAGGRAAAGENAGCPTVHPSLSGFQAVLGDECFTSKLNLGERQNFPGQISHYFSGVHFSTESRWTGGEVFPNRSSIINLLNPELWWFWILSQISVWEKALLCDFYLLAVVGPACSPSPAKLPSCNI